MFVGEGDMGALHWQRGLRWTKSNSGGIRAWGLRRRNHSFGRLGIPRKSRDAARRTSPQVGAT